MSICTTCVVSITWLGYWELPIKSANKIHVPMEKSMQPSKCTVCRNGTNRTLVELTWALLKESYTYCRVSYIIPQIVASQKPHSDVNQIMFVNLISKTKQVKDNHA